MEEYYKKRYESVMEALHTLQRTLDKVREENTAMQFEKLQWQAEKAKQQQIIAQALAQANQTSSTYLEENRKLKQENDSLRAQLEAD